MPKKKASTRTSAKPAQTRPAARTTTGTPARSTRAVEPHPVPRRPLEWHDHLPHEIHWNAVETALRASVDAAKKSRSAQRLRADLEARLKRLQELRAWFHQVRVNALIGVDGPDRVALGRTSSAMHRARKPKGGAQRGLETLKS